MSIKKQHLDEILLNCRLKRKISFQSPKHQFNYSLGIRKQSNHRHKMNVIFIKHPGNTDSAIWLWQIVPKCIFPMEMIVEHSRVSPSVANFFFPISFMLPGERATMISFQLDALCS